MEIYKIYALNVETIYPNHYLFGYPIFLINPFLVGYSDKHTIQNFVKKKVICD